MHHPQEGPLHAAGLPEAGDGGGGVFRQGHVGEGQPVLGGQGRVAGRGGVVQGSAHVRPAQQGGGGAGHEFRAVGDDRAAVGHQGLGARGIDQMRAAPAKSLVAAPVCSGARPAAKLARASRLALSMYPA